MDTYSTGYLQSQFVGIAASQDSLRVKMADHYRLDETEAVEALLRRVQLGKDETANIFGRARRLVVEARKRTGDVGGLDAF